MKYTTITVDIRVPLGSYCNGCLGLQYSDGQPYCKYFQKDLMHIMGPTLIPIPPDTGYIPKLNSCLELCDGPYRT